ncbi:MAG: hypothetical protein IIA41_03545 [SAR324 cluster bacterium]|nr:hypothetical protein [SAR324 cluster bacterium]
MKLAGKPYEIHLLAVIVLYVLGFVVYLNSFPVPFVFDDYPNIRDNPSIRLTAIDLERYFAGKNLSAGTLQLHSAIIHSALASVRGAVLIA